MKKDICKGDAVVSTAGRDSGQIYIVLKVDCDYVSLANGHGRKAFNPKRKNIRHINIITKSYLPEEDIETSGDLDAKLHFAVAKLKGNINVKGRCYRN